MNIGALAFVAASVISTLSAADTTPVRALTEAARKKATEEHYAASIRLHDERRDPEARVELERAYFLTPNPNILFNLARLEQLTDDPLLALRHYKQVLRELPALKPGVADMARMRIAELNPQFGHITIQGAEDLSEVTLDDEAIAKGGEVDVKEGKHVVKGKAPDRRVLTVEVTAAAGATVIAQFPPASPPTSDGVAQAPGPQSTDSVTSTAPTYEMAQPTPKKIVVGSLVAGTVVFVAGAIYWQTVAASRASDQDAYRAAHNPVCTSLPQTCEDYRTLHRARVRAVDANRYWLGAAAITGVAAIGTWLLWPKTTRTRITPTIGGILIEGSF